MATELYDIDTPPPLGEVPPKMHAWVIRPERFGDPMHSFEQEVVDVPDISADEVLVYVMAAGVNYNNVWAGSGEPVDVIAARQRAGEQEAFHIGGSDASGVVYRVGSRVSNLKVGDEVVIHCGTWSPDCPVVRSGADPTYSPSMRTWGYQTNWGSFAQFTRVQAHQCLPRPKHLSWASAASYMAVGASAYRMLTGWGRHAVRPNDVVLCWGGAGGLGSMAIQITRAMGGVPVAVVSSDDKKEYCERLGAKGCIKRTDFAHWGTLPHFKDRIGYGKWLAEARAFGEALWEVVGERRNPRIVFEHPGERTIPTSIFVCQRGGMVVTCAGTTGYNASVDLRYMWTRQKRLQGSHLANDGQARALNELVMARQVDPCTSQVFAWDELARSHQLMHENRHPHGNMAVLVGAHALETSDSETEAHHVPEVTYRRPGGAPRLELAAEDDPTRVSDVMTDGVVTCPVTASLIEAASLLLEHRIHAAVVTSDGQAVGVVSQTDLVLARQGRSRAQAATVTVGSIMTPDPVTCEPDMLLADAVTLMTRLRIHRLFIANPDAPRVPVGVLSYTDILKSLVKSD